MPKGRSPARVFLDANTLFSAAYSPKGRCAALFELPRLGSCELFTSAYAVTEAERNLRHKKPAALKLFPRLLAQMRVVPEPDQERQAQAVALGIDEGDVDILAAALGRCEALITGDRRHFGRWMGRSVKGIQVMSPADALAAFL